MSDYDAMCDELDALEIEQQRLAERTRWLQKRVAMYPVVVPMLVYYRFGSRDRDEALTPEMDEDPLADAYRQLRFGEDYGELSAVGVEVGGAMISMEELDRRYSDKVSRV